MSPDLKALFKQMADLTLPECKKCRVPLSCCSPEYCQISADWTNELGEEVPEKTEHPSLPFMGKCGCVLEPHQRLFCTFHTCRINGLGTSGSIDWDKKYFKLREQIEKKLTEEFPS